MRDRKKTAWDEELCGQEGLVLEIVDKDVRVRGPIYQEIMRKIQSRERRKKKAENRPSRTCPPPGPIQGEKK